MQLKELIEAATIEQAQEWKNSQEQFTFCIDILGISAHASCSDNWVWALEARFEKILKQERVQDEYRALRESAIALIANNKVHFTFDPTDTWIQLEAVTFPEVERALLSIHPKAHNLSNMREIRQCGPCTDYEIDFNIVR